MIEIPVVPGDWSRTDHEEAGAMDGVNDRGRVACLETPARSPKLLRDEPDDLGRRAGIWGRGCDHVGGARWTMHSN